MAGRQHTTPLILERGDVTRLTRVPLTEKAFTEGWLQTLLFEHPELIPVEEIEPVFGPLYPVARELRTDVGPVDLLYVNPEGFLTIAETKLWRNPQARREVVAQLIDYAKCLALWSYEDLRVAVCSAARGPKTSGDPIVEAISEADDAVDVSRFSDTIARNLRLGRFLLLVVGDGIQESVEQMAEFLARTPQLGFTLALVEMALFRPPEKQEPLLIQPRVVARTREVVRAIVEVRTGVMREDVHVTIPTDVSPTRSTRAITEDDYYDRLKAAAGQEAVEFVKAIVDLAPEHDLDVIWSTRGPAIRYVHEGTGHTFKLARFLHDGMLEAGAFDRECAKAGIPRSIATDYLEATRAFMPGSVIAVRGEKDMRVLRLPSGEYASFLPLARARDGWLATIDGTVKRIDAALGGEQDS